MANTYLTKMFDASPDAGVRAVLDAQTRQNASGIADGHPAGFALRQMNLVLYVSGPPAAIPGASPRSSS